MSPTAHAVLGASSSHRWFHCPGSIRASEGMPNTSSVFAREGTAAHALAEPCLSPRFDTGRVLAWGIAVAGTLVYPTDRQSTAYGHNVSQAVNLGRHPKSK